jgi:transposase
MKVESRKFTKEFKQQAVDLAISIGNYTEAARQLGISDSTIHGFRKQLGLCSETKKNDNLSETERELRRLRKENAELKKVNFILKEATAFFSQLQQKK